ncbi:hypothetical protein SAMN05421774_10482 [Gemmobacter megaterium]|uniref:Uncharacterized protein n=1 Tax=Gemmobacter megaterium TaxID=1086013 RepID=A0A1N7NR58_9RHOB|nr:DUF6476 family protein [Gemmobacter megaterium]GGE17055.1 hypothetical protein GCM10011345_23700 [Gemmobacter megaterium]SIT00865.1 hypothetical protein SAMN05421774_10482 [Gemmobacter megaterium]
MALTPDDGTGTALPASVRLLQWLVIGLTASMIVGVIAVVVVVVTRFPARPTPPVPEMLELPDGATALSVAQGADWIGITTTDDRILIYDRSTGVLRQTITLSRP